MHQLTHSPAVLWARTATFITASDRLRRSRSLPTVFPCTGGLREAKQVVEGVAADDLRIARTAGRLKVCSWRC